ncbi:TPA: alpha-amylase family protein [Klebsiella aerogenes]|uniref:alpha-amylase family protein n=1 Tax=Klebsiella aerogenes TaxID=548 RepID=UPI00063C8C5B|nr:alpha-amylase family protein [Klebsiella aerogenes]ELA1945842.1 alpha-amylase family protein [Klebsiella aerogenes]ELT6135780.1 alpha-amylase family protein [Klebsiella aerogenes]EMA4693619.1 alpha-amylase family protein [Klebsiella aerogenes]KLF26774.1 glycosidase [Klebsiella aerogenes]WVJ28495.1 alpha-amylase family protein [Klebsiella aerogenes]
MPRQPWFQNAVIYQVDTSLFYDANGDGCGDLAGIRQKLYYLRSFGVTVLWLTPFYLTPFLDDGYDVQDHLQPDPRFGQIRDVIQLIDDARELGKRVIIELVIQHTSSQHPWFLEARKNRHSPFRPYYLWADSPPEQDDPPMFPGVEKSVWRWDQQAGQYYRHMFYRHEPDLNLVHPPVIDEIDNIVRFWLRVGVSGFRLDAASHLVKQAGNGDEEQGYWILAHLRQLVEQTNPEAILLGEVDVAVNDYRHYFGHSDRLQLVLNFWLNKFFYVSLARQSAKPLVSALQAMIKPPPGCCFANWLRNHDELDLEGIEDADRQFVLRCFAPEKSMSVYQRGIRRRLAPMLEGNIRRLAFSHAVLLSLPGVPVMRYGDEIGMGEDLSLKERYAVRTPMQWSAGVNGGFSTAAAEKLLVRPVASGPWRYQQVNVELALRQRHSLLQRVRQMVQLRAEYHEPGATPFELVSGLPPSVLALRYRGQSRDLLMLANFSERPVEVRLPFQETGYWSCVLEDRRYRDRLTGGKVCRLQLADYGYRWFSRQHD